MKGMQCLVAGGSGFIGKHLVKKLMAIGAKTTSLGLSSLSSIKGVTHIKVDLANKVESDLRFDYVFNLSGFVDHSLFWSGGRKVIDAHYVGLLNLIMALDKNQLKGFIQVGSSDEYGDLPAPQVETMRERPSSSYSAAKLAATQLIQMLAKQECFPGTVLRLFLVYGPGQNKQRFLPQVIEGCLRGASFPVSKGEQLRDFCYMDDVIDALIRAAMNREAQGEVINIASGQPVSIASMIKKVKARINCGEPQFGSVPYRSGENMSLYADISKAKQVLGWEPTVSLADGLEKTIAYFKKNRKGET
jgi:nucleoside-diphosphate-sugar epimerase